MKKNREILYILAVLLCCSILPSCGRQPDILEEQEGLESLSPIPEPEKDPEPDEAAPGEEENSFPPQDEEMTEEGEQSCLQDGEPVFPEEEAILEASDKDAVKRELLESIQQLRQPRVMDISLLDLEYPELDIKNIYYGIAAEYPELKYAYDLIITVDGTKLNCQLCYMPYKTGIFQDGFLGEEVGSIKDLIAVAEHHLGETSLPVCITNTQMEPDAMNRALQQVGGGYILCSLNRDATFLQYSVPPEMTMEGCIDALKLADAMADEVIAHVVTEGMTQREQAEAVYSYLTQTVSYDQRYYSDRSSMPYESQTAVGALRDHLAICGGYANALKLLYEKIGIPCYNISGRYFREYHMWNLAEIDGEWFWFDATSDRGNSSEYGFLRFALTELDAMKYQYDEEAIRQLLD